MDTQSQVAQASAEQVKTATANFLESYLSPSFGARSKNDTEQLVFDLLVEIGALPPRPSTFDLVSSLRVTRSRARRLIYERELRRCTPQLLEEDVKNLLLKPLLSKSGSEFLLEIDSPVVADHLRGKLHRLGHISDGSFSPSLVRLSVDAMAALVEDSLNEKERDAVRRALVAAGAPDKSVKGVLTAALKCLGKKLASDAGEALAEGISDYMSPILTAASTNIRSVFKGVFL